MKGVWPPTKPCADDEVALNKWLGANAPQLAGSNCSHVYPYMQQFLPNFTCDSSDIRRPTFRDMCCSVCGGQPIPDVPPPAPSPPSTSYQCAVCNHVYDPTRDGGGKPFEDLPDDWTCPICGAPKKAYHPGADG